MSRRVPAITRASARIDALRIGTPAAVRAWAREWGVPLINPEDDELLLITIHEARIDEPGLPAEVRIASKRWLKENRARIVQAREMKHESITSSIHR